jgi:hypothetical protein
LTALDDLDPFYYVELRTKREGGKKFWVAGVQAVKGGPVIRVTHADKWTAIRQAIGGSVLPWAHAVPYTRTPARRVSRED